jgi:hypothetical protein
MDSATAPKSAEPTATTTPAGGTASQPVDGPASSSGSQTQSAIPANGTFVVLIRAREDSWLSISVDGEIVTRALLAAPLQKSIRAEREIVVRAGNVGALDFEFNGKKLPAQGDYGEVKSLTFGVHGLQPSTSSQEAPAQLP